MIELNSVAKRYGSLLAVDDVTFSVKDGEYFALLGPNGAGKTTIVRMLLDFTPPTSGSLSLSGASEHGCGLPEGSRLRGRESPHSILSVQAGSTCSGARNLLIRPLSTPGPNADASSPSSAWRAGNIRKRPPTRRAWSSGSALGAALMGHPRLLILDEPVSGLDPIGIREVRLLLESLKE